MKNIHPAFIVLAMTLSLLLVAFKIAEEKRRYIILLEQNREYQIISQEIIDLKKNWGNPTAARRAIQRVRSSSLLKNRIKKYSKRANKIEISFLKLDAPRLDFVSNQIFNAPLVVDTFSVSREKNESVANLFVKVDKP